MAVGRTEKKKKKVIGPRGQGRSSLPARLITSRTSSPLPPFPHRALHLLLITVPVTVSLFFQTSAKLPGLPCPLEIGESSPEN